MDIDKAIKKRRSIRKFTQEPINADTLKDLVNCARLAPSVANLQPLEYIIIIGRESLSRVFGTLKWAAYIAPEGNPKDDERPVAYIIVLVNKDKTKFSAQHDIGAAVENILLACLSKGIGSCWLISFDKEELSSILELSDTYEVDSVIALGYPAQESIPEEYKGDIKYSKDDKGNMHVPKRTLEDIIYDIR